MFLQYDNKKDKKRILILMSQYGIDWLRESTKNHSDGTFRTCPYLFYQFYFIFYEKTLSLETKYAVTSNTKFLEYGNAGNLAIYSKITCTDYLITDLNNNG